MKSSAPPVAATVGVDPEQEERDLCRVGIGNGLPSMGDYGLAMSLMEQLAALGPDADPAQAEALYGRLSALEERYWGPTNPMPGEVGRAPDVAVLMRGFGEDAAELIESLHEPVTRLEEPEAPFYTDQVSLALLPPTRGLLDLGGQAVVVLPTGSLYGLGAGSAERAVLQSFAERGGVVVAFTQPFGADFSALPVPAGQELAAVGYRQDMACWADSAYAATEHPILSGLVEPTVTAGVDGFFRKVPAGATVLLRRRATGEPCMVLYPVGSGWVLATTLYEDWAWGNRQSSADGRGLLANLVAWAKAPASAVPVYDLSRGADPSQVALSLRVRNLSREAADRVEVVALSPERTAVTGRTTLSVALAPGEVRDVPISLDLSEHFDPASPAASLRYGIHHADYRLLRSQDGGAEPIEVQPLGEDDSGRFVAVRPSPNRRAVAATVFSAWVDSDWAGDPAGVVHLHVEDHTGGARTLHLWHRYMHGGFALLRTIELPANGAWQEEIAQDLSRPGAYHFYLTDPEPQNGLSPWPQDGWYLSGSSDVYLFGNEWGGAEQPLVRFLPMEGVAPAYEAGAAVEGKAVLEVGTQRPNPMDLEVTLELLTALGPAGSQTAALHLEPGQRGEAPFRFSLPPADRSYDWASLQVTVRTGGVYLEGFTRKLFVREWSPQLSLEAAWPEAPPSSTFAPVAVRLTNLPGERVASSRRAALRGLLFDPSVSPSEPVETVSLPVPDLEPGATAELAVQFPGWQPTWGHRYKIWLEAYAFNPDGSLWGRGDYDTREFALTPPSVAVQHATTLLPGEAAVSLEGEIVNGSGFLWDLAARWALPDDGQSFTQALAAPPASRLPIAWELPGAAALGAGPHRVRLEVSGPGLAPPLYAEGTLVVEPPAILCDWPPEPPVFRHDRPTEVTVSLRATNAAAPLGGTCSARLLWEGGSAPLSERSVSLSSAAATPVAFSVPVDQMPAPGPFQLEVFLSLAGQAVRRWTADFALAGPSYTVAWGNEPALPGGTAGFALRNLGGFEGEGICSWDLRDTRGAVVAESSLPVSLPCSGETPLSLALPATLLPGPYWATVRMEASGLAAPLSWRHSLEVGGEGATLRLTTDRSLYGPTEEVALTLGATGLSGPLQGAQVAVAVQRWVAGGTSTPGASWGSPDPTGTGSRRVSPSRWFLDPDRGSQAYLSEAAALKALADAVPPVAADVDGDGRSDYIALSEMSGAGPELDIAPGFDLVSVERYPVAATWGSQADAWDRGFGLGAGDFDADGRAEVLLGVWGPASGSAALLLVRPGSPAPVWRADLPASWLPRAHQTTLDAQGPVFADLEGDGHTEVLVGGQNGLLVLDAGTGGLRWSFMPTGEVYEVALRVSRDELGGTVWALVWRSDSARLFALQADGSVRYEVGLDTSWGRLCTGDVDGDGAAEAVFSDAYAPALVFQPFEGTPFPSPLAPYSEFALHDVDGDGVEEVLHAGGTLVEGAYRPALLASSLLTGASLWEAPLELPYSEGHNPLTVAYAGSAAVAPLLCSSGGWVFLLEGRTGLVQSRAATYVTMSRHALAADYDGDGLSEWYEDGWLLDEACPGEGGVPGPCGGPGGSWRTVWAESLPLPAGGTEPFESTLAPGALGTPGRYRAVASAATLSGQTLGALPALFLLGSASLALLPSLAEDSALPVGAAPSVALEVVNRGSVEESEMSLSAALDGVELPIAPLGPVAPGSSVSLPLQIPALSAGEHLLVSALRREGATLAESATRFAAEPPAVEVSVEAPAFCLGEPFDIRVRCRNTGRVPTTLALALSDSPAETVPMALSQDEERWAVFPRSAPGGFAAALLVTGDVQRTIPVEVARGYALALDPVLPARVARGLLETAVPVSQGGMAPFEGTLQVQVSREGRVLATLSEPLSVGPGQSVSVPLQLPLEAVGRARVLFALPGAGVQVERELEVYDGGVGTVLVSIPETMPAGLNLLESTVTNALPEPGLFRVVAAWEPESGPRTEFTRTVSLGPLETQALSLAMELQEGRGAVVVLVNGAEVARRDATVLAPVAGDLSLEVLGLEEGAPALRARVDNTGFGRLEGQLTWLAGTVKTEPVLVEAGGSEERTFPLDPEVLPDAVSRLEALLELPGGRTLTAAADLDLTPAAVAVRAPSGEVTLAVPGPSLLAFEVTNGGDRAWRGDLWLELPELEGWRVRQPVEAPGRTTRTLEVALSLPEDLPPGLSFARYALLPQGVSEPVASGVLPIRFLPDVPSVEASVDGTSFPVGGAALVTVNLGALPSGASRALLVRALSGAWESEREVLSSGPRSETFSVPVAADTEGVTLAVLDPGGRTLYLNSWRIYPIPAGFSLVADRSAYGAGETANLTATLLRPGTLTLSARDQQFVLEGSGTLTQSLVLPAGTPEGPCFVTYAYAPSDLSEGASGVLVLEVRGTRVHAGESRLDRASFASSQDLTGTLRIQSEQPLGATVTFWIQFPDGTLTAAGTRPVTADGRLPTELPFAVPFVSTMTGTHRLAFSVLGPEGVALTGGSLPFSCGTTALAGVAMEREDYASGAETVALTVRTTGAHEGQLDIALDGTPFLQAPVPDGSGGTGRVVFPPVPAGEHTVAVVLTDPSGGLSEARCRFRLGSSLPDLEGYLVPMERLDGVQRLGCRVTNRGASAAAPSHLSLYDGEPAQGGQLLTCLPCPEVPPGGEVFLAWPWDLGGLTGDRTLSMRVDSGLEVAEWDETDNEAKAAVSLAPPPSWAVVPPEGTCSTQAVTPAFEVDGAGYTLSATLNGEPFEAGTVLSDDGDYELAVSATDAFGLARFTLARRFAIDREPPAVEVAAPTEGACVPLGTLPDVRIGDAHLAGEELTLNGEPFAPGAPLVEEGDYLLAARAWDTCGNTTGPVGRRFTIDVSAPTVVVTSPAEGETVAPGFAPTFEALDAHDATVEAWLDGTPYAAGDPVGTPGPHTLSLVATDPCGNTSETVVRSFRVGPSLPASMGSSALFGCGAVAVHGGCRLGAAEGASGPWIAGGHVGSDGPILVAGANRIAGDARPGPGSKVTILGRRDQVSGSTAPSDAPLPCEPQNVSEWATLAQAQNDNSAIPTRFLDARGNLVLGGHSVCTLPGGTYWLSSLTLSGEARLVTTGPTVFVVAGTVVVGGSAQINPDGPPPWAVFVSTGGMPVVFTGDATVSAMLYAPLSFASVTSTVRGLGSIWAQEVLLSGGVQWRRWVPATP